MTPHENLKIVKEFCERGLKVRPLLFITELVSDRQLKLQVGWALSDSCKHKMGVTQGSILWPILFSIKRNN